jgi:hypothetical protein
MCGGGRGRGQRAHIGVVWRLCVDFLYFNRPDTGRAGIKETRSVGEVVVMVEDDEGEEEGRERGTTRTRMKRENGEGGWRKRQEEDNEGRGRNRRKKEEKKEVGGRRREEKEGGREGGNRSKNLKRTFQHAIHEKALWLGANRDISSRSLRTIFANACGWKRAKVFYRVSSGYLKLVRRGRAFYTTREVTWNGWLHCLGSSKGCRTPTVAYLFWGAGMWEWGSEQLLNQMTNKTAFCGKRWMMVTTTPPSDDKRVSLLRHREWATLSRIDPPMKNKTAFFGSNVEWCPPNKTLSFRHRSVSIGTAYMNSVLTGFSPKGRRLLHSCSSVMPRLQTSTSKEYGWCK